MPDGSVQGTFQFSTTEARREMRALGREAEVTERRIIRAGRSLDTFGGRASLTRIQSLRREIRGVGTDATETARRVETASRRQERQLVTSAQRQTQALSRLRNELVRVGASSAAPEVRVNGVREAIAEIQVLRREMAALDRQRASARVGARSGLPGGLPSRVDSRSDPGAQAAASSIAAAGAAARGASSGFSIGTNGAAVFGKSLTLLASAAAIALPAIQSLIGAAGALGSVLASAGAAGGALAAAGLGSLTTGLAGLISVGKPATNAIKEAFKAQTSFTDASKAATTSVAAQSAAQSQQRAAVNQLRQANQGLEMSQRNVRNSIEGLRDAQVNAKLAQDALTQSRRDAARALTDMSLAEQGSKLSVERAALSVTRARTALTAAQLDPAATADTIKSAGLDVRQSLLDQKQARVASGRATADNRRAQRRGIGGDPGVRAAGRGVRGARTGVRNAREGVGDARRQVVESQRAITEAGRSMREAARAMSGNSDQISEAKRKMNEAFAKAPKGTRELIANAKSFKAAWKTATKPAQENFVKILDTGLKIGRQMLPTLAASASRSTSALSREVGKLQPWLTGDSVQRYIKTSTAMFDENLGNIRRIGTGVADTLMNITRAARPILRDAIRSTRKMTEGWASSTSNIEGTRSKLKTMYGDLKSVAGVARSAGRLLVTVFKGGRGEGRGLTEDFTRTLDRWNASLIANPEKTREFFKRTVDGFRDMADMAVRVVGALDSMATRLQPLLTTFSRLVGLAADLAKISPALPAAAVGAVVAARRGGGGKGGGVRGLFKRRGGAVGDSGVAGGGGGIQKVFVVNMGGGPGGGPAGGGGPVPVGSGGGRGPRRTIRSRLGGVRGRARGLARGAALQVAVPGRTGRVARATGRGAGRIAGSALGVGKNLLRGGAKAFLPATALFAALDFMSAKGNVWQKGASALNSATLGLSGAVTNLLEINTKVRDTDKEAAQKDKKVKSFRQLRGRTQELRNEIRSGKHSGDGLAVRQKLLARLNARDRSSAARRGGELVTASQITGDRVGAGAQRKEFKLGFAEEFKKSGLEGKRELTRTVGSWIAELDKGNAKQRRSARIMTRAVEDRWQKMGVRVRLINGEILKGTRKEWKGIENALGGRAEKALQRSQAAFTAIQKKAVGSLRAAGYSKSEADAIIKATERGGDAAATNTKTGISATKGDTAASQARRARGGRIGGVGLKDTVPVAPGHLAAPGELIVNRHTERRVNRKLGRFGTSLGREVEGESRPHSAAVPGSTPANDALGGRIYAVGGRVGADLKGANPALAVYGDKAARFGLSVTSGKRVAGGRTASGGISQHGSGDALDVAGPPTAMLSFARDMVRQFGKEVDQLIHTPMGFGMNRGQRVASFGADVDSGHFDHVHIGDSTPPGGGSRGAGGVSAGGEAAGGIPAAISRTRVGAAGVAGILGQRYADVYTAALNKNLAAAGGGGGGGGGTSTYSGPLDRDFGRGDNRTISFNQAAKIAESVGLPGVTYAQIAKGESGLRPGAVSPDGGFGLWQMTPRVQSAATVKKWEGIGSYFNPVNNAKQAKVLAGGGTGVSNYFGTGFVTDRNKHYTGNAMGGRIGADFGGWFAKGGSGRYRRPTMIGVGDGQATGGSERVTVERVRGGAASASVGGPGGVSVNITMGNVSLKDGSDLEAHLERAAERAGERLLAALQRRRLNG